MNICIDLPGRAGLTGWPRLLVLVLILVVVGVAIRAGFWPPEVITFTLGAGFASAQVARAVFPGPALDELG